jgi:hypothetical protein
MLRDWDMGIGTGYAKKKVWYGMDKITIRCYDVSHDLLNLLGSQSTVLFFRAQHEMNKF